MIIVIGAGRMGRVIAQDLSRNYEVLVADSDQASLSKVKGIRTFKGSFMDIPGLAKADLVVTALPSGAARDVVEFALGKGRDVVDISFTDYDPFEMDKTARTHGCMYLPHAGFAPGLSNILAGKLYFGHGSRNIEIIVAGLQEEPMPPMGYIPTFNASSVIDEYTRPARFIENGILREVQPLETVEPVEVEGFGRLDSFYSDGLSTILQTFSEGTVAEKTLRYPGHMEKMKFLNEMGYFSSERIGMSSAREISDELFRRTVREVPDVSILKVVPLDHRGPEYTVVDHYDHKNSISSMGRMTGYSAAAMATAVLQSKIQGKGTYPAEWIGKDNTAFSFILDYLKGHHIDIKVSE